MYGKTYMGIERSTFLINGDGDVVKEWRKVKIKDHVTDVLSAVTEL
jgi:peroxiredoxin Q/BCP